MTTSKMKIDFDSMSCLVYGFEIETILPSIVERTVASKVRRFIKIWSVSFHEERLTILMINGFNFTRKDNYVKKSL